MQQTMQLVAGENRLRVEVPDTITIEFAVTDGLPPCTGDIGIISAFGIGEMFCTGVLSNAPGGPALARGSQFGFGKRSRTKGGRMPFFLGGKVDKYGFYPTLGPGTYYATFTITARDPRGDGVVIDLHRYGG